MKKIFIQGIIVPFGVPIGKVDDGVMHAVNQLLEDLTVSKPNHKIQ